MIWSIWSCILFSSRVPPKTSTQLWKSCIPKEQAKWTLSHRCHTLHFLSPQSLPPRPSYRFRHSKTSISSHFARLWERRILFSCSAFCFDPQVMGWFGAFSMKSPLLQLPHSIICPKPKHLAIPLQISSINISLIPPEETSLSSNN